MIQAEGIFAGGGAVTAAPIIGKDFNWSGGDGTYVVLDDGDGNWRIKFLSSGTFTPLKDMVIDVFLVGGGGGRTQAGGGGGYTTTVKSIVLGAGTAYAITVGAGGEGKVNGGASSAFGSQALGGYPGYEQRISGDTWYYGGNGGSGGAAFSSDNASGGVDGGNGNYGSFTFVKYRAGTGQGTTTREFGEATGGLYASGGGTNLTETIPNSGNGAASVAAAAGIVIIRQHKEAA